MAHNGFDFMLNIPNTILRDSSLVYLPGWVFSGGGGLVLPYSV